MEARRRGGEGRQTLREEAVGAEWGSGLATVPCLRYLPGKQSASAQPLTAQKLSCVCYVV